MTTKKLAEGAEIILKETYDFNCPSCNKLMYAKPSLFMKTGMANLGGGICINKECNIHFSLAIDENNERMIAELINKKEA